MEFVFTEMGRRQEWSIWGGTQELGLGHALLECPQSSECEAELAGPRAGLEGKGEQPAGISVSSVPGSRVSCSHPTLLQTR